MHFAGTRAVLPAIVGLVALIFSTAAAQTPAPSAVERFWPQWRGPYATGVSKTADPPLEWSETKNIRWKIEIPGRGSSSPIVWGDRVFLLTAVPATLSGAASHRPLGMVQPRAPHRFVILAINRKDGSIAWERTAREEVPHEGAHQDNGTWASSSAITDGERVFAYFESHGLFAYDMNGRLLWEKDLGDKRMRNQFGEGSTPALYGNRIVIVWDHQGQSFIVALDKRTGEEIWRVDRPEIDTWATPLIVDVAGRPQVIVPAMRRLRSYDLEDGRVVWESAGLTMNPIPSPVAADGMVFATSGYQGSNLKAIRLAEAKGDITGTPAIVWTLDRDTPYVPSPLLYDGILYILKSNSGILSAFDAKTGKPHYQLQRLEGVPNVFASPVGARDRSYFPGREGTTLVIRNSPAFEILAKNILDDGFDASPALVDKEIYLRGYEYLYCIAAE
ncbi:MAG TPA: PQQ-binding-like beta-propeller repeat protein [Terriglobia bacterium]|nr:PQQ-binding-like beta-propeller repeat protein [Terriglobia bacterium]